MRATWKLAGVLLCAVLAAGCETTQPLQLDEQTFEVMVEAVGAGANSANVWDMYRDSDNNGDNSVTGAICSVAAETAAPGPIHLAILMVFGLAAYFGMRRLAFKKISE